MPSCTLSPTRHEGPREEYTVVYFVNSFCTLNEAQISVAAVACDTDQELFKDLMSSRVRPSTSCNQFHVCDVRTRKIKVTRVGPRTDWLMMIRFT
eukprot:6210021-Pleurochrysis_carterae.AAC.1